MHTSKQHLIKTFVFNNSRKTNIFQLKNILTKHTVGNQSNFKFTNLENKIKRSGANEKVYIVNFTFSKPSSAKSHRKNKKLLIKTGALQNVYLICDKKTSKCNLMSTKLLDVSISNYFK